MNEFFLVGFEQGHMDLALYSELFGVKDQSFGQKVKFNDFLFQLETGIGFHGIFSFFGGANGVFTFFEQKFIFISLRISHFSGKIDRGFEFQLIARLLKQNILQIGLGHIDGSFLVFPTKFIILNFNGIFSRDNLFKFECFRGELDFLLEYLIVQHNFGASRSTLVQLFDLS